MQTGETVMDICRIGASFISRSYSFWEPSPILGTKTRKFTMGQMVFSPTWSKSKNFAVAPMRTFCFVTLTLRNPRMEIGEIIPDMLHRWFSLMHVLIFGDPPSSPFLKGGGSKTSVFVKVENWQLTTTGRNMKKNQKRKC